MLTEQDKYWINLSDDLHFLGDDQRFLWSSERAGFRHLVSLRSLRQATRAAHAAATGKSKASPASTSKTARSISPPRSRVPIERQFYRVALSGGAPVQLTHEHGTHDGQSRARAGAFPRYLFERHEAAAPGPLPRRRQRRGGARRKSRPRTRSVSFAAGGVFHRARRRRHTARRLADQAAGL